MNWIYSHFQFGPEWLPHVINLVSIVALAIFTVTGVLGYLLEKGHELKLDSEQKQVIQELTDSNHENESKIVQLSKLNNENKDTIARLSIENKALQDSSSILKKELKKLKEEMPKKWLLSEQLSEKIISFYKNSKTVSINYLANNDNSDFMKEQIKGSFIENGIIVKEENRLLGDNFEGIILDNKTTIAVGKKPKE